MSHGKITLTEAIEAKFGSFRVVELKPREPHATGWGCTFTVFHWGIDIDPHSFFPPEIEVRMMDREVFEIEEFFHSLPPKHPFQDIVTEALREAGFWDGPQLPHEVW